MAENKDPRWSEKVHPKPVKNKHIFDESAEDIAKYFSSPKVSPGGVGQAIRKLNFYINRAGSRGNPEHIAKVREALKSLEGKEHEVKASVFGKVSSALAKGKNHIRELAGRRHYFTSHLHRALSDNHIHASNHSTSREEAHAHVLKSREHDALADKHTAHGDELTSHLPKEHRDKIFSQERKSAHDLYGNPNKPHTGFEHERALQHTQKGVDHNLNMGREHYYMTNLHNSLSYHHGWAAQHAKTDEEGRYHALKAKEHDAISSAHYHKAQKSLAHLSDEENAKIHSEGRRAVAHAFGTPTNPMDKTREYTFDNKAAAQHAKEHAHSFGAK